MFIFLLLAILFPLQIFAGVGDSDNRYYVTDEMWSQEPYKKFVWMLNGLYYTSQYWKRINETDKDLTEINEDKFEFLGTCSAQYISPNLILSAGHCIFTVDKMNQALDKYPYLNNNPRRNYRIKNYKHEFFDVKLVDTAYTGEAFDTLGDWAVWLVTDPQYYSDAYFDIKVPSKTIDVINAGWGWCRIIEDKELEDIKKIYHDIAMRIVEENKKIEDKTKQKSISVSDLADEISTHLTKPLDEFPYKLKASKCKIVFDDCSDIEKHLYDDVPDDVHALTEKQQKKILKNIDKKETTFRNICNNQQSLKRESNYPYILATTCDTWQGNSGGGYMSLNGKNLYGTCSYGASLFTDKYNTDYIVSSKQFDERIKKLIKKYDSKNSIEENIKKIPDNLYGDTPNTISEESSHTGEKRNLERKHDLFDMKELEHELTAQITDIPNMSNEDLLQFLNKLVEHKVKTERLEELQKAYEEAKANEQSLANRTLTALTVAATGLGGMELARGLAEQKADKEAEADMTAYIETMRCTYGDGKQVKAGPEEIELPGGNNAELMKLRSEYFALAADLKERKEALGMKPGIESEVIMDKSQMGLYDDENIGITDGAYASLYRAKALNSETDQAKINEDKEASKKRVIGGAVAAGAGVVGGVIGNSMINGKLGEKIKNSKNNKNDSDIKEKMNELCSMGACKSETIKNMNDDQIKQVINKIAQMKQLKQQGNTDEPELDLSNIGEILKNKNLIK